MNWLKTLAALPPLMLLGACATTPDVTVGYYLPRAEAKVQVIQSADCDASKTQVFVANTVTLTTVISSDRTSPRRSVSLKALDGAFANTDAAFKFTEDGRLQSVNASSTGKGEDVIKSGFTLAATVARVTELHLTAPVDPCEVIAKAGGSKPVTLTYGLEKPIVFADEFGKEFELRPDPQSMALHQALKASLPRLTLHLGPPQPIAPAATYAAHDAGAVVPLTLNHTGTVQLSLVATQDGQATTVWTASPVFPLKSTYDLPIPKAALFGKETFSLTLGDSGAINSVGYGKETGVASALNAANTVAAAGEGETAAQRAADLKAQVDLIAQQQKLVRCTANPAACS